MEDKEPEFFDWQDLLQLTEDEYVDVIDVEEEDDVW
tara:strand:- start:206 stop:313 length:108 start_codon:yes stop_codon:yes gene_type:complete